MKKIIYILPLLFLTKITLAQDKQTGTLQTIKVQGGGGGHVDSTSLSNRINSKQDTSYHTNFYAESPQLVRDTLVIEGADTIHGVISSLDNLNMPELSYEAASRDTTNWRTNNTLVDEQFLTNRINGIPVLSASGQTTLVAGTKSINVPGVTASSTATLGFVSIGGTVTTTWQYAVVCTTDTVTITALTNAGATNTSDTSILNYSVVY